MNISHLLPQHTAEAKAHEHVTENDIGWDTTATIDETVLALCSSYRSFERYLSDEHLYIIPRSRNQLESILRRYSTDAIHNAIAKSRNTLEAGGYSRVCHLATISIRQVLETGDNVAYLLALHAPNDVNPHKEEPTREMMTP
ncbi:hypothetical protein FB45DRAFT_903934 [Roridomyces roridus]|uniref:Uncharacterized protein n=1 Tax=Roridomyces roridus TaxID=1738132 RepID=A0AAD7FTU9_9AGAR|nr:hypothetical protein FB45DRAFT_903934 [Roridomyces roridus]